MTTKYIYIFTTLGYEHEMFETFRWIALRGASILKDLLNREIRGGYYFYFIFLCVIDTMYTCN